MHLKSLTLRGFKSFASATTLEFEPGITCVVGPNGSGKSNVVDAIAWVMGEQGAKSLRGGKMDDVIFAGTSQRAPLGRAQVVLTIDNSDGALPIDYSEVTISRTLFRSGQSEYAINGDTCRLLDVQELLSDSGIGREMHVIVGQGKLDEILHASPEDRRGFIEEAAGVLKHRKRKEKALRKLEAMAANLTRLTDLTGELRRQLKPLGKQAEVARRANVIAADLRDSRLRLLADDLVTVRTTLEKEATDEALLRERRGAVEQQIANSVAREAELEAESAIQAPLAQRSNELALRLVALRERFAGLVSLASERVRNAEVIETQHLSAPDPEQLDRAAAEITQNFHDQSHEVARLLSELDSSQAMRIQAEQQSEAGQLRAGQYQAQLADRRETLARCAGDVRAAMSGVDVRTAEIARLGGQLNQARERLAAAADELARFTDTDDGLDDATGDLATRHEAAVNSRDQVAAEFTSSQGQHHDAQRELAGLDARIEALGLRMESEGGATALADFPTVLGTVADLVRIEPGYAPAIAAALASGADGVAVADVGQAVAALVHLRNSDSGRTSVVIGSLAGDSLLAGDLARASHLDLPVGSVAAGDVVHCAEEIAVSIQRVLGSVVIVNDIEAARVLVTSRPDLIAVTRDGDLLSTAIATGGCAEAGRIQVAAVLEQTYLARSQTAQGCDQRAQRIARLAAHLEVLTGQLGEIARQLATAQASLTKRTQQIALLGSQRAASNDECGRLARALAEAQQGLSGDTAALAAAEQQLAAITQSHEMIDACPDPVAFDALRLALHDARQAELESRLAVRTGEERAAVLANRANELTAAALAERQARVLASQLRSQRERQVSVAVAVLAIADAASARLEVTVAASKQARLTAQTARTNREAELVDIRSRNRELAVALEQLTNAVHSDEVARTSQRMRVDQIETKALEEFGIGAEVLLTEYGPQVLVPPSGIAVGDEVDPAAPAPQPYPFVRQYQQKRLNAAEKSMALLGRVNPLALEEFSAMEERHAFLTTQLDDLKRGRRDLLDIVADVDERVQQVFSEAFADVQEQFAQVFGRLFPGGEGRLVLTDPSDLLTTGIEVEARPAGKKIKRLSLLSGGERSLTAVAFLIALFKARPSPFYLLDEVEAALDDINLGRLLVILEELRSDSQLLVITHQKRTMEIGDALYGITMRDGVTQVISQRLRELQTV